MRYNINFVLLGLSLVTIVSMVLLVIYYHSTYGALNKRYRHAIAEVEAVAVDLNKTLTEVRAKESLLNRKEKELLDYVKELNLSKERESSLGEHFTELRGEKEDLTRDLNASILEKEQWKDNYYASKQELDVYKVDYKLKVSELNTAKREVSRLEEIGDSLKSSSNDLSNSVANVNNKIGDVSDDTGNIRSSVSKVENDTVRDEIMGYVRDLESNINKLEQKMNTLESVVNTIKAWISSM